MRRFFQHAPVLRRRLVIFAKLVRKAGVRIGRDRPVGDARQDVEVLAQLTRSEGAVEADGQRAGVPVAVWNDESSLAVAVEEVDSFRRHARTSRV